MATGTIQEINELGKAVNDFSTAMKENLSEHAAKGKRGWNKMTESELAETLNDKLRYYYSNGTEGPTDEKSKEALLEIASYCMFVYTAKIEGR